MKTNCFLLDLAVFVALILGYTRGGSNFGSLEGEVVISETPAERLGRSN